MAESFSVHVPGTVMKGEWSIASPVLSTGRPFRGCSEYMEGSKRLPGTDPPVVGLTASPSCLWSGHRAEDQSTSTWLV